ncbi:unnamed protein product [Periconia digitata]|uniref:Chromatin assembly factor 1 subunit A n=1 Tax=Periconia digitata TaxID=1303443 RepID=A0A9W4U6X4_9PLEO|nr:unnamed protein product [Periconia digitata]
MEAPVPAVPFASPQKRPLEDDAQPSTPNRPSTSTASTPLSILSSVATPSPVQQQHATSNTTPALPQSTPTASSNAQPPAKKRKLTPQEKEAERFEKEAKAKARAEKKEQKEAEDKLKAEKREEERKRKEDVKQKKEEEKRKKEDEKRKKEEDKQRKERSQLKLNAFFSKPKATGDSTGKSLVDNLHVPTTGSVSLAPDTGVSITNAAPPSPQKAIRNNAKSDYERFFLPFAPPPYTTVASQNALLEDPEAVSAAKARMEKLIAQEDVDMEPVTVENFRSIFPKRRRGMDIPTIGHVVGLVNGSAHMPMDSIRGNGKPQPLDLLKKIPMKYLHFSEDVRPPYFGTYTRSHTLSESRKVALNPVSRGLKELDYDYDSEAEWEEPEEGEDIDSDDEEDLDEEMDEEMEGFLDDEEATDTKRRLLNGDQEPVSSGLCWEDANRVSILNDGSGAICTDFRDFRMGCLLESQPRSIDPFSTIYWGAPDPPPQPPSIPGQPTIKSAVSGLMNPPRLPLSSRPANGLLNTLNLPSSSSASLPGFSSSTTSTSSSSSSKPKQTIPPDQLAAFKAAIDGQDLTKIAMIEALKKKFPKLGKQAISDTLGTVAKRVGSKQREKVWVLL